MNTIGLNADSLAHADAIRAGHDRDGNPCVIWTLAVRILELSGVPRPDEGFDDRIPRVSRLLRPVAPHVFSSRECARHGSPSCPHSPTGRGLGLTRAGRGGRSERSGRSEGAGDGLGSTCGPAERPAACQHTPARTTDELQIRKEGLHLPDEPPRDAGLILGIISKVTPLAPGQHRGGAAPVRKTVRAEPEAVHGVAGSKSEIPGRALYAAESGGGVIFDIIPFDFQRLPDIPSCLPARNRVTATAIRLLCRLSHRRPTRQRPLRYSRNHRNRRFILPILPWTRILTDSDEFADAEDYLTALRHLYEQKKAGNEDGIKAAQAMVDSIAAARSMTQDDLTTAFRRAGEVTVVDQAEDGMLVVNRVKEYFAPDTFQGAEAAANAEMEIRPKSVQVEAVGDGSASIDNVIAGIEDAPAQAGDSANNAQLAFADVAQVEDAGEGGQGRKKKSVRFAGTETIDFDFADRGRYASELQDAPEMLEWQMFHGTDVGELRGVVKARGKRASGRRRARRGSSSSSSTSRWERGPRSAASWAECSTSRI